MTKQHVTDEQAAAFIRAAHDVAAKGLARCSSGNLSQRLSGDGMLITGSRSWMESLEPHQLAVCRISDGLSLGGAKPSVETSFHAGIFRLHPDANVVLHFQSPFATVVACRCDLDILPFDLTPEMPFYIGKPGLVPFLMPGSPALADAVMSAAASHRMIILRNHGQVTYGATFQETIQRAVFFEMTCELIVRGNGKLKPLNESASAELTAMGGNPMKPV